MSWDDEGFSLGRCQLVGETEKAVKVYIPMFNETCFLPKSQLHMSTEIVGSSGPAQGELVIATWLARERGYDRLQARPFRKQVGPAQVRVELQGGAGDVLVMLDTTKASKGQVKGYAQVARRVLWDGAPGEWRRSGDFVCSGQRYESALDADKAGRLLASEWKDYRSLFLQGEQPAKPAVSQVRNSTVTLLDTTVIAEVVDLNTTSESRQMADAFCQNARTALAGAVEEQRTAPGANTETPTFTKSYATIFDAAQAASSLLDLWQGTVQLYDPPPPRPRRQEDMSRRNKSWRNKREREKTPPKATIQVDAPPDPKKPQRVFDFSDE